MAKETTTKQTTDEHQKQQQKAKQTQTALPHPADALQRLGDTSTLRPSDVLALQQTVGNQAVQRALAEHRQPERNMSKGSSGLGVVQRHEENNAKISEMHNRVAAEELISDEIIGWTQTEGPKIKGNKEKVDKVGNYVKNEVIPWETNATHEINALRDRVANLEGASGE